MRLPQGVAATPRRRHPLRRGRRSYSLRNFAFQLHRSGLEHFYKRHGTSCGHGRTLPGPDQSARGLAQSKTLARIIMALVCAKRLGLRWPSTAFPIDVSLQQLLENNNAILWQRSNKRLSTLQPHSRFRCAKPVNHNIFIVYQ
jgi:hypothetical protein